MAAVSDEALVAELEEMFGSTTEEEGTGTEPESTEDNPATEDTDGSTEEGQSTEEDEGKEPETTENKDDSQAKQNHAFAEMRTQNKKLTNLITNLGKALNLEDGMSVDDISNKVQEALLQKQSKDTNVPVEMLQRLQSLEVIAQEAERNKLEKQVSDSLTSLSEKYGLSGDQLTAFATDLAKQGKNPLEVQGVDIESEYIKMHQQDIIQAAVDKALSEERNRKDNIKEHAGGKVPGKSDSGGNGEVKISTVAELGKALDDLS